MIALLASKIGSLTIELLPLSRKLLRDKRELNEPT
jgi:hypothetical protein